MIGGEGQDMTPKLSLPRRSRRGMGLPSLVVVLFFGAVVVQSIALKTARDTTEARSEAAFNMAKENLDTFQITMARPDDTDMPHLVGSRYIDITQEGPNRLGFAYMQGDNRSRELFEQKLRAYVNIPNGGDVTIIDYANMRPEYPERIRRAGDWMVTNLDLNNQDITNINETFTGRSEAETVDTVLFTGIDTTLIEAPLMDTPLLTAVVVEGDEFNSWRVNLTGSLDSPDVGADLQVRTTNMTDAQTGTITGTTTVNNQLVSDDRLQNAGTLTFDTINVDGMRTTGLRVPAPGRILSCQRYEDGEEVIQESQSGCDQSYQGPTDTYSGAGQAAGSGAIDAGGATSQVGG